MLIVGNYIEHVKCESFLDPETGRVRVRPMPGQGLPVEILIECSKRERYRHPVDTKFYAKRVKVCKKPDGRVYLRAKDQMIYKLKE